MPLEHFENERVLHSFNVYSYSFIVFNVLSKGEPFSYELKNGRHCLFKVYGTIKKGIRPHYFPRRSSFGDNELIRELFENCWCSIPKDRWSADRVLEFITSEDFCFSLHRLDYKSVLKYLEIYGDELFIILKRGIEAIFYLTLAANQNDLTALNNLAALYYEGKYIKQDVNKAIQYLTFASNQNQPDAQYNLGNFYFGGHYIK